MSVLYLRILRSKKSSEEPAFASGKRERTESRVIPSVSGRRSINDIPLSLREFFEGAQDRNTSRKIRKIKGSSRTKRIFVMPTPSSQVARPLLYPNDDMPKNVPVRVLKERVHLCSKHRSEEHT